MGDFKNPQGLWSIRGFFTIELTSDDSRKNIPKIEGISFYGNVMNVSEGEAFPINDDEIKIIVREQNFCLFFRDILAVRNSCGRLVWKKDNIFKN